MKFTTIFTIRGMSLRERASRLREWAEIKVSHALPSRVRYWATIHQGVQAIDTMPSNMVVGDVSFLDVVQAMPGGSKR